METQIIEIYTDGSCNSKYKIGGWAAIIFIGNEKVLLHGVQENTTHNRMELIAVIEAVNYVLKMQSKIGLIRIFTDSQYVAGIPLRAKKLISKNFITKKGKDIQNVDLIKTLTSLIQQSNIEFVKVMAHQKLSDTINYNREVDKLARKLVRKEVDKIIPD
ncbi:MAG: ribonuclease H [Bacteroidales bacterium]